MAPQLIDLSHTVGPDVVTYPGLPPPEVGVHLSRDRAEELYGPGVRFHIGRLSMVANTGTYLDTPFHRFDGGHDLTEVPLDAVADVPGVVVDASGAAGAIDSGLFDRDDLSGAAVLIRTGWDRHWNTPAYADGHPFISAEVAERLAATGARVVGIDSLNIDSTDDPARPAHTTLLGAGTYIVEHLRALDQLDATQPFRFFAVPVKVSGLGTFPVRAFAIQ